jgi:hypothetical protein
MAGSTRVFPQLQPESRQRTAAHIKPAFRTTAVELIRKHRWLLSTSTFICVGAFVVVVVRRAPPIWILGLAAALLVATYFSGYVARAFKVIAYPSLLNLPRRSYAEVWDALGFPTTGQESSHS